ncbi:MAG: hypothetical protein AAF605_08990 [Myxococcota bacterium]
MMKRLLKKTHELRVIDDRSPDEIIGYGEFGLPGELHDNARARNDGTTNHRKITPK